MRAKVPKHIPIFCYIALLSTMGIICIIPSSKARNLFNLNTFLACELGIKTNNAMVIIKPIIIPFIEYWDMFRGVSPHQIPMF